MILQTDYRLQTDPWWGKAGCAIMDVFYFVNKFTNYPFDTETMLILGDSFRKHDLVGNEFYVKDWQGLFNYFPSMQVVYTNRHETPDRQCQEGEFEILDWYNPRTGKRHFTAGNGHGYVTYDPMGESLTVKEGFLRSKRIFQHV